MKLVRNVSWTFGANLFVSLTKWLVMVVIAKILTPQDVGAYSLAFAVSAPITLFANMKLRSLFITDENRDRFIDYVNTRTLLSVLALLLLAIISLLIYPSYFLLIILVGMIKILDLQSDMYYALPHKESHMSYIGKIMVKKNLIIFIAFLVTMILTNDLVISLTVQLLIQFIYFSLIEKKSISEKYYNEKKKIVFSNIKKIILLGAPLGFVQMMFSFNSSYPRYLLEFFESAEILGYFSAIAYVLTIGNMMMNAVSQTFLPLLANKIKNKDYISFKKSLFMNLTFFSIGLGSILIGFSSFFGEAFLNIIYGAEYSKYVNILVLMSVALAINFISWNFDTALLALRYISIQPKISLIMLIINLLIGYLLIKDYGINGAVYTIIITNSIQLFLRALFVNIQLSKLIRK